MNDRPKQVNGLEINEVADGVVVYQKDKDRVHYMNKIASMVLQLCDGETPTTDFPLLFQDVFELDAPPHEEIHDCLEKLFDEGLVE